MPEKKIKFNIVFLPILLLPLSIIIGQIAVSLTLLSSVIIFIIKKKEVVFHKSIENLCLLFFFIILIIGTLLNNDYNENVGLKNIISSFLYTKFLFLYLISSNSKIDDRFFKDIKIIFLLSFFCLIFVLLDTLFQYFHPEKIDIFGYKAIGQNAFRLTGPFGFNEAIPGSYMIKISFVSLIFFNLYSIDYLKIKKIFIYIFLATLNLSYFFTILISGERISFLMAMLSSLIVIIFIKKLRAFFVIVGFLFILVFTYVVASDKYIKSRYIILTKYFISNDFVTIDEKVLKQEDYLKRNDFNFLNNQWGAHYLTSIEIFKDNPYFGSGIKGFRNNCGKSKYENIKSLAYYKRCSSHSHNLYFELISETGILGLLSILTFVILMIFKSLKLIINLNSKNLSSQDKIILSCFIASFAVLISILWPLRSSGSLFSNLNGSMIWISFCFLNLFYRYFKSKKYIININ